MTAPAAIILAAGKGTRMGGDPDNALPKCAHLVADRPMVAWVVDACLAAGCERIVVVVGYRAEVVQEALGSYDSNIVSFALQSEQLGTGHAAAMAQPELESFEGDVFVLNGDGPLIRAETLEQLLTTHRESQAHGTVATSHLPDPTGYGRVVRDEAGNLSDIVEQKDATPEQLAITEINPNYLCYRSTVLFDALSMLSNDNAQGEYYLTDVPRLVRSSAGQMAVVDAVPPEDVLGINTPEQLAEVDAILRRRLSEQSSTNSPETGDVQ